MFIELSFFAWGVHFQIYSLAVAKFNMNPQHHFVPNVGIAEYHLKQ